MQMLLVSRSCVLWIFSTTTKQQQKQQLLHYSLSFYFSQTPSISPFCSTSSKSPTMASDDSSNYGFNRPEMYSSSLANTVNYYERHVFLCYKNHESWPSSVESSDDDPLPKMLASALKARKDDIPVKVISLILLGFLFLSIGSSLDLFQRFDWFIMNLYRRSDLDNFCFDLKSLLFD